MSVEQVKCFKCSDQRWLGEAPAGLRFVGLFRNPSDRLVLPEPRLSWRCRCGWTTVFEPASVPASPPSWQNVVLKRGA